MTKKIKRKFDNLEDFFSDWFYIENKTWLTLSEFVTSNKLENFITSRQVSDILLGKAYTPPNFSSVLSYLSPFEITPEEIKNIADQTRFRNRLSYKINISYDAIEEFKNDIIQKKLLKKEKRHNQYLKTKEPGYIAQPRNKYTTDAERAEARRESGRNFRERSRIAAGKPAQITPKVPLTEDQRKESKKRASQKYEAKLSYQKKVKKINKILENIISHKQTHGETIEKKIKKPRQIYNTEEERLAARKAQTKKSNESSKHQEWRESNPDKVLQYGRNWRKNNQKKEKEVRHQYKSTNRETINQKSREAYHLSTQPKRVDKLIGILRGIEHQKIQHGEEIKQRTPEELEQYKKYERNTYQREYRKNKNQR